VGTALQQRRGQSGDPERAFVAEMNRLAGALGMRSTRFANPHGLDLPRGNGYSTAADMARLSIYSMRKPAFAFFVRQEERRVTFQTAAGAKSFRVVNTNVLLKDKSVRGIKTGTTAAAGECLATCAERDPIVRDLPSGQKSITPRRLIIVVLGSPDRFANTRGFINHGWMLFDQWAAAGAVVPEGSRDFLRVPSPR
jgi:D-alanyl-D-alanine carboxypeptidase (penicillin-binding protein 5/6)